MSATVINDLSAELDIPSNGCFSRMLYRDDLLRVVGFSFDTGEELTEHSSAFPAVIQVVRGRLTLTLGDEKAEASTGTWIHLPARLRHTIRALEPTVMLLTMLPVPDGYSSAAAFDN
jgi:quercetin dioxygenase-like cupin family protein